MNSFNYNANFTANTNRMTCYIDNGAIYSLDFNGSQKVVGYTAEEYNQLSETTTEYYNKLVEVGIIVPPKTPEQINAELQNALIESQSINRELIALVNQMKGGNVDVQSPTDSEPLSKAPAKQTKRNTASDKPSNASDTGAE